MVATKQNAVTRQRNTIGDAQDKIAERRRPHPGIAAVLVDLVRSRLDQCEPRVMSLPMAERSLDHQRMRRAHRIETARLASLVPRIQVENGFHCGVWCSGAVASS